MERVFNHHHHLHFNVWILIVTENGLIMHLTQKGLQEQVSSLHACLLWLCMSIIKPVQLQIPLNLHLWLPPGFCTYLSQMHCDYLIWGCRDNFHCVIEVLVYTSYIISPWYFERETEESFLLCFLPLQLSCHVSRRSYSFCVRVCIRTCCLSLHFQPVSLFVPTELPDWLE